MKKIRWTREEFEKWVQHWDPKKRRQHNFRVVADQLEGRTLTAVTRRFPEALARGELYLDETTSELNLGEKFRPMKEMLVERIYAE